MKAPTHITGGITAGLIYLKAAQSSDFGLAPLGVLTCAGCLALAVGGSLIPDLDTKTSKAGHAAAPASATISFFFGHRTVLHGPLLYIALYILAVQSAPIIQPFAFSFLLGILSHIWLDMLNPRGVPLLYPVPAKFHTVDIPTGGFAEYLVLSVLAALNLYIIIHFII